MAESLEKQFDIWIESFQSQYQEQNKAMTVEFDEQFISPCQQSEPNQEREIEWKPVLRDDLADFSGVEHALELTLHPDIKSFYGRYWSEHLNAQSTRGQLQLLQAWNLDDFDRLLQNLIGHVLMKQKLGQRITLFLAVTDEEDFIITMDNENGNIMLEQVGLEPRETLADNLAEFLSQLTPVIGS